MELKRRHKHSRAVIRDEAHKNQRRVIERMRWAGEFVPPMPYRLVDPAGWWQRVVKLTKTRDRKPCSCSLCGNPRRHFNEKPISELRMDLRDADDYDYATDDYMMEYDDE